MTRDLMLTFLKMHGLGNDFVVVDARDGGSPVTPARARAIGDRHRGVGFDQLVTIHASDRAAARLVFWNQDGSTSDACGNATRCVADLLMAEDGSDALLLETGRGLLACERAGDQVRVNMGPPGLDWRDVPLAEPADTVALPLPGAPGALSMGNPHCAYVVEDAEAVDMASHGPAIEHHPLFPERTNLEIVQVLAPDRLRLRIWERGVGVTLASGSCACAAVVATARKGLCERAATVVVDGGALHIDWREDGVWMTGPVARAFRGEIPEGWL